MGKLKKIILTFKKYGFLGAFKKIYNYLNVNYFSKINIFEYIYTLAKYKKVKKSIQEILNNNYERIIVWRSSFGWDVPLFQRPQHISKNLANKNCLVL